MPTVLSGLNKLYSLNFIQSSRVNGWERRNADVFCPFVSEILIPGLLTVKYLCSSLECHQKFVAMNLLRHCDNLKAQTEHLETFNKFEQVLASLEWCLRLRGIVCCWIMLKRSEPCVKKISCSHWNSEIDDSICGKLAKKFHFRSMPSTLLLSSVKCFPSYVQAEHMLCRMNSWYSALLNSERVKKLKGFRWNFKLFSIWNLSLRLLKASQFNGISFAIIQESTTLFSWFMEFYFIRKLSGGCTNVGDWII